MRVIRSPLIFFIEQQEQITRSSSLRRAIWSERANSKLCKFFNLWELNLKKYILSAAVILFSKRQKSAKSLHSEVLYIVHVKISYLQFSILYWHWPLCMLSVSLHPSLFWFKHFLSTFLEKTYTTWETNSFRRNSYFVNVKLKGRFKSAAFTLEIPHASTTKLPEGMQHLDICLLFYLQLSGDPWFKSPWCRTLEGRVGPPFFSKECNVLVFFSVLYKWTWQSLRSFPFFIKERCICLRSFMFFIKERGVLWVLLCSL